MSISNPPNYGSPDWQRGYYSAQKLLAAVPAGISNVTVNVPSNCETLVILGAGNASINLAEIMGVTSGTAYPFRVLSFQQPNTPQPYYVVDVLSAVDSAVSITLGGAPLNPWYVVADAAAHVTVDAQAAYTKQGVQYIVPTAPNTASSDHPAIELRNGTIASSEPTAILPAPGGSQRYRIFSIAMMISGGTSQGTCTAYLYGSKSGQYFHGLSTSGAEPPGASVNRTFPLTGLAMQAGESLNLNYDVGAGTLVRGSVLYTLENI